MKQVPYQAPDFSLPDENGEVKTLADFKGKWLVLYFYPKDDTPGCTTEACSLRDARDGLMEAGAEVVGISKDQASDHEKFKAKYKLNFTLLSDSEVGSSKHMVLGVRRCLAKREFYVRPSSLILRVKSSKSGVA
ncbi:hypothetical protein RAAC3_TM7C00001G0146 [Candidatus Saccharibacteria bacterium RAAC3_TM7_1]|nr:hypothetical protein RAAC3_TM7C00001G0146 [Candidatus Saccharibacteria bacterium RAAC3_TM7_1]